MTNIEPLHIFERYLIGQTCEHCALMWTALAYDYTIRLKCPRCKDYTRMNCKAECDKESYRKWVAYRWELDG
jgi:phage FluMu protein Com